MIFLCWPSVGAVLGQGGLAVDLGAHDRNRLLVDSRGIPLLDHFEVGLAFLISLTGLPAFFAQEVGSGGHGVRLVVEVNTSVAIASTPYRFALPGRNWVWPNSPWAAPFVLPSMVP